MYLLKVTIVNLHKRCPKGGIEVQSKQKKLIKITAPLLSNLLSMLKWMNTNSTQGNFLFKEEAV